jgi:RNA polymerase sigma-70 factor (ECF subfamily)
VLLVLRHFEGRDTAEIAEMLDVPVGTVHSRLHHAHLAMRAALDADARAITIEGRPA